MATASEIVDAGGDGENAGRNRTTHDFLCGVKERETLKQELNERERELVAAKSQNYDLIRKIEALEMELTEIKQGGSLNTRKKSSGNKRVASAKKAKPLRPAKRKLPKKSQNLLSPADSAVKSAADDPFDDPEKLYQKIAERYPELPLSTVLAAETKFVEADENRDGTIDAEELEKILDNSKTMFTKQQILGILEEIDEDKTNTIDFFECLQVLDLLRQNRNSRLPSSIQQNKSSICSVQ